MILDPGEENERRMGTVLDIRSGEVEVLRLGVGPYPQAAMLARPAGLRRVAPCPTPPGQAADPAGSSMGPVERIPVDSAARIPYRPGRGHRRHRRAGRRRRRARRRVDDSPRLGLRRQVLSIPFVVVCLTLVIRN
ncbi:MAG: hypothetical protein MZV70_68060 [Desulfobacterales bacterium]|nr:hypothetical protein [Desulfobacterales bacterium]